MDMAAAAPDSDIAAKPVPAVAHSDRAAGTAVAQDSVTVDCYSPAPDFAAVRSDRAATDFPVAVDSHRDRKSVV